MDAEDEFQRYREIGERNTVVLTLVRNWCQHAEVAFEGSGGMFQAVTGLPIAMSRVTCKHERSPAAMSMHLESNALDFYDRNCVDCDKRVAVNLPNLSSLVGERDRARQNAADAIAERQRRERGLLERRATERGQVFIDPTPAQRSLISLLDRLDREPSKETEHDFIAGTGAVGDVANETFWQAVIAVLQAGGDHRARAALLALEANGFDSVALGNLALQALVRGEAAETAADLALRHMSHCHREQIRDAAPALLLLARDPFSTRFEGTVVSRPETLAAAHRKEPDVIQEAIEGSLASDSKEWRRAGCFAIATLVRYGGEFDVAAIARAIIASFRLPDAPYLSGPASSSAAWVLAELCRRFGSPAEALLLKHEEDGDDRVRSGVFQAYAEVFRERDLQTGRVVTRDEADGPALIEAETRALRRIVAIISNLVDDGRLRLAIEFLRRASSWITRLPSAGSFAPVLLGTAAMASERAQAARRGSSMILDSRPELIRGIEAEGIAFVLRSLESECIKAVTHLACQHPVAATRQEVTRLFLETLRSLPDHEDRFKAALVGQLGSLFIDRALRATILPEIYSAMTDASVAVRSAASAAYAEICGQVSP
jgi:hypothetical protein